MSRWFPGIALVLFLGCSDGAEVPAIELGGPSGARLMNGRARTTFEAYDNAYSQLTKQHYNVRRNLDGRNTNLYAARAAMERILSLLETLRVLVPPGDQARFDPYLVKYQGWHKDLDRGTWGGSFLQELDRTEQEVKSKFHPDLVELVAEAAPVPPPKEPVVAIPADKVEMAVPKTPSIPPPTPAVLPPRICYKAWSGFHDDLLEGYKADKDCKARYEGVIESLRLLKPALVGEQASKLQVYIDYYGAIHEKTLGFSVLPEKTTKKDIVDELDVAARVIRKEFNPDK
jgi:hypothetical protein